MHEYSGRHSHAEQWHIPSHVRRDGYKYACFVLLQVAAQKQKGYLSTCWNVRYVKSAVVET